jgi:hypothetical protein
MPKGNTARIPSTGRAPAAAGIKHGGQPPQAVPLSAGNPGHLGITDTPHSEVPVRPGL